MWHFTRFLKMTGLWSVSLWSVSLLVGAALGDDPKCLKVGDSIPEFQCMDDQGKMWDSRKMDDDHWQRRPHPQSANGRLTRKRQSRSLGVYPQGGGQIVAPQFNKK